VRLIGNVPTLMLNVQTGRCDVVVYDAPALGTLKARAPARYGPFVGVIDTRESYGIAFPKGGTLVGPVDRALDSLLADGSVDRLAKKWLTVDPAKLRVLR
jgi:glutamine transport system substrate-binding protein